MASGFICLCINISDEFTQEGRLKIRPEADNQGNGGGGGGSTKMTEDRLDVKSTLPSPSFTHTSSTSVSCRNILELLQEEVF